MADQQIRVIATSALAPFSGLAGAGHLDHASSNLVQSAACFLLAGAVSNCFSNEKWTTTIPSSALQPSPAPE
eukprot:5360020-Pyramimonas_sp.AAC.1